jgi:glycosyltransferase 2 family protein
LVCSEVQTPINVFRFRYRYDRVDALLVMVRKILLALVGLGVGIGLFWFSSRSVDLQQVRHILLLSSWQWVVLGVVLFGVDLLVRAGRSVIIVSADGHVRYVSLFQGLIVGYAVNVLLPARLGELYRADYTARITKISRSRILGSIFVERLADLAAVLLFFIGGVSTIKVADAAVERVVVVTIVVSVAAAAAACLCLSGSVRRGLRVLMNYLPPKILSKWLTRKVLAAMSEFSQTVRIIHSRRMFAVLALTFFIWLFEAGSMWSVCMSVGLHLGSAELITLLGGASLSTLFPTAPGFVGSYQFAFVEILGLFNVQAPLALGAALAMQIYLMGLFAIVGLTVWCLGTWRGAVTVNAGASLLVNQ